jgi:chromosome segregation ATPase
MGGLTAENQSYKTQLDNMNSVYEENGKLRALEVDLKRARTSLADDEDLIQRLNF